jgi:hypothetical protein
MVMDANRPAGEGKSHADGSANAPGCAGHKHRMFLVYLVHLVSLVALVCFVQPNKRDKPNKPDNDPIMGGMKDEGKPTDAVLRVTLHERGFTQ